ncbi:MAG TPA: hypothetical protein VE010_05730, partial [Thermoanaerobaculia bacterium]|nr:hypothetical protein [Thermoanaerobaculia bacterium]
ERWSEVLAGMTSGLLKVGSRAPVRGTPVWITLEVLHGGFVSGRYLAGGPLLPHEPALLRRLPEPHGSTPRARINSWYVGEEGFAELQEMLSTGRYRIDVPEEGALLTVAWLTREGFVDEARRLLDVIGPWFDRLRFYPRPAAEAEVPSSDVHLQPVSKTVQQLERLTDSKEVLVMRDAIRVWSPLYDRAVALWMETVDGAMPSFRDDAVEGGWPCQTYPADWPVRARALLDDYGQARRSHREPERHRRSGNFARLRAALGAAAADPKSLTGAEVAMIRRILALVNRKRGLPGSARLRALRESQAADAARLMPSEIAHDVASNLKQKDSGQALRDLDEFGAVPEVVHRALLRSRQMPLKTLLERKVARSSEALASVVPQLTSSVRSRDLPSVDLQRLYAASYEAFRRRRSLLLFNLQSQVRFEELPWISAIETHRTGDASAGSRALLEEVVRLAIAFFPHTIFPNKLLKEIRSLAVGAGVELPITDELAADIFQGTFSATFLAAAKRAATLMRGSLYERYYRIPYADVLAMRQPNALAELCEHLAGVSRTRWWRSSPVAQNGAIIEQAQIVTTHNLAPLFEALDLTARLRPTLIELASKCLAWIEWSRAKEPSPRLATLKNRAYAWRQMVFFLSFADPAEVRAFFERRAASEDLADLARCYRTGETVTPLLGWRVNR